MILAYYGKCLPIEKVRADCDISRDGSTAKNIMLAAQGYDLEVEAYKLEPEELKKIGMFPCVIHWNFNHFVVLKGIKGSRAYLNDPAYGDYSVSMEIFDQSFTGICLFMTPNESFAPEGQPKSIWSFAKERLKRSNAEIAAVIMLSVILLLVGILNPLLSEFFIDWCLGSSLKNIHFWFFGIFLTVGMISILGERYKAYLLLKIDGKMSVIGNMSFVWKVLNLPMSFFSQRLPGDLQLRQSGNAEISTRLIQIVAPMIINAVITVFYLVVMTMYSPLLTAIAIFSVTVNLIITHFVTNERVNLTRVQMMEKGQLYSSTAAGIDMIEMLTRRAARRIFG